jgi:DNA-binding CsgD family transcriptional regulator
MLKDHKLTKKKSYGVYMSTTLLKNHVLYTDYRSISEICAPLEKINTHGFIFMRHFREGHFIDLSNQLEWSDFFLNRYMQKEYPQGSVNDHMFIADGVSLWTLNRDNLIWREGETYFNFGNGISIAINTDKYTDIFCFYAKYSQYEINRFYISNIGLLKKFSEYFLEKAEPIIKRGMRNPLMTPDPYLNKKLPASENSEVTMVNEFLSTIDPAYRRIMKNQPISERELQCIKLCAGGNSAAQAADTLFISKRTVEAHLRNARLKLECANLSELVSIVLQYYDSR